MAHFCLRNMSSVESLTFSFASLHPGPSEGSREQVQRREKVPAPCRGILVPREVTMTAPFLQTARNTTPHLLRIGMA